MFRVLTEQDIENTEELETLTTKKKLTQQDLDDTKELENLTKRQKLTDGEISDDSEDIDEHFDVNNKVNKGGEVSEDNVKHGMMEIDIQEVLKIFIIYYSIFTFLHLQDAITIDLPLPDANICNTDHILIDEEPPTNKIEQGIESINLSSEECVDLNDFITKNKDAIEKIAKVSEYSMYRKARTQHEKIVNMISTKLKLRDTGGKPYGDGSQEEIYGLYRKLRKEKYPKKQIDNLLEEALQNCAKPCEKKKYQSKIGDFFHRKSEVPAMIENKDTIEVVGQEQENEHDATDIHAIDQMA